MIGGSIEALRSGNARDRALAKILEGVLEARGGEDIPHTRQASPTKTEPTHEPQGYKVDLRQQTYDLLLLVREPSVAERQTFLERRKGFVFLPLEAKSLAQVIAENKDYFWREELAYVNTRAELRDYVPPAMELALNPNQLVLPGSFRKPRVAQLEMIEEFSRPLEEEFPGAKAIMLSATGYAQADKAYRAQTGQVLFRNYFARALDNTSAVSAAGVGRVGPDYQLLVRGWAADGGRGDVGAVPAVVFLRK